MASTESGLIFGSIAYDRSGSRMTDQAQVIMDDIRVDILVCLLVCLSIRVLFVYLSVLLILLLF